MTVGPGFDRRRLWLLLVPLGIYALAYAVIDQARPAGVPFPHLEFQRWDDVPFAVAAEQAKYHYFWLSSYVVLTAVCLAVGTSAAVALRRETPRRDASAVRVAVGLLVALVVAVELFGGITRWYTYLGEGLYDSIFAHVPTLKHSSALAVFLNGQQVIKIAVAIAVVVLSACMILTLKTPPPGDSVAQKARFLQRAMATQRNLLQQTALVYVFAVIAMIAGMYWPLPFLADDAARAAYRNLLTGSAILQGVAFSLGAAAVYLPAALLLRQWSEAVTHEAADAPSADDDTEAALEALAVHPFDQFRQVAMMVLPMLVSLGPLLTGFSSLA
jgi:hypothetical protein